MSPEERLAYEKGYMAGRRRERVKVADRERGSAALSLFESLVSGLIAQGLTLDDILDAQLIGARVAK